MYFYRSFLHTPFPCNGTQVREACSGPCGFPRGVIPALHSLFFEAQRKKGKRKKKKPDQKKEPNEAMVGNLVCHLKSLVTTSWDYEHLRPWEGNWNGILGGLWSNKNPFIGCTLNMLNGSRFSFRCFDAKIVRMPAIHRSLLWALCTGSSFTIHPGQEACSQVLHGGLEFMLLQGMFGMV